MGFTKKHALEEAEKEWAQLHRDFDDNNPDLVAAGWDYESWNAFMAAIEKDD